MSILFFLSSFPIPWTYPCSCMYLLSLVHFFTPLTTHSHFLLLPLNQTCKKQYLLLNERFFLCLYPISHHSSWREVLSLDFFAAHENANRSKIFSFFIPSPTHGNYRWWHFFSKDCSSLFIRFKWFTLELKVSNAFISSQRYLYHNFSPFPLFFSHRLSYYFHTLYLFSKIHIAFEQ